MSDDQQLGCEMNGPNPQVIPDDPGGYLAVGGFMLRIKELEAEVAQWKREALRQYPTPDAYDAVCHALAKLHEENKRFRGMVEMSEQVMRTALVYLRDYKNDAQGATHARRLLSNAVLSFDEDRATSSKSEPTS